jgi:Flp pilus assembly protein TadG
MLSCLRRQRDELGVAALEFALVFTFILAPLLFGTLEYGLYFWGQSSANAAVREGARRSSVGDYADCGSFRSLVALQSGSAVKTSDTIRRTFATAAGVSVATPEVGDIMTVSVSFQAVPVGFFPLPNGGAITSDVSSRVESVKTPALQAC